MALRPLRARRYSIDERWLQRCDRKAIGADLAEGCGCPKQCTDQLAVAMVEEERKSEGKKGGVLRRSELRHNLESNRTAATKLGFKLHIPSTTIQYFSVPARLIF